MTEQPQVHSPPSNEAQVERLAPLHFALFAGGIIAAALMNRRLREDFSAGLAGAALPDWRLIVGVLLNAAPVAALVLAIIRWRQRTTTFPSAAQFGHWLLLTQGAVVCTHFLTSTPFWRELLPAMRDPNSEFYDAHWRIHLFVLWLGCISVPCFAVCWAKGEDLWRFYTVALILSISWMAWLNAFNDFGGQRRAAHGVSMLLNAAVMLTFSLATVRDLFWRARDKDPLHWIGIGTTLVLMTFQRLYFFVPI